MRKIKFRGKCKICNEWIEGDLIHGVGSHEGGFYILPHRVNLAYVKHCDPLNGANVIPETIGQFTGLHDKDGKEIWEGDVVESEGERKVVTFEQFEVDCCGCCYESHRVVGFNYLSAYYSEYHAKPVTVLGNIHDNPELLKQ